jgi:hypothetical protein
MHKALVTIIFFFPGEWNEPLSTGTKPASIFEVASCSNSIGILYPREKLSPKYFHSFFEPPDDFKRITEFLAFNREDADFIMSYKSLSE